ncbi:MAG: malto-oligosyltrehalose synthase [Azospirillum sp.]|nr:malto-oligosyltrehalose synthase [Azospirillum sp.]
MTEPEARTEPEAANPPPVPIVPSATYRLQFRQTFTFRDAERIVPYLHALGVNHLYSSSILTARPSSSHGYDIVDHSALNPELGTREDFDAMVAALHAHGMGLLVDFVPNHMGIGGADNPWWLDVLEWGRASPFAEFFDIDWAPAEPTLKGKVLLPFLGDYYGQVLENGQLTLRFDDEAGTFSVWYYQHRFPIAVRDTAVILRTAKAEDGGEALGSLADEFAKVPVERRAVRQIASIRQSVADLRGHFLGLVREDPRVAAAIGRVVEQFNGSVGEPASFRKLHELLERQHYRLAFWRVATAEINYRRFFDINDLAGLRIEDGEVFELCHQLIFRLIALGKIQGLRIDHVDGLHDPAGYCRKLQDRAAFLMMQGHTGTTPAVSPPHKREHLLYLVVEKILAPHERTRDDWAIDGTTGYDFMNAVNGVFVDTAAERALTETYARFIGRSERFDELVVAAKRQVVEGNLASELAVLVRQLHLIARQTWKTRDLTFDGLRQAMIDVVSHFAVYRTYIGEQGPAEEDGRELSRALAAACRERLGKDRSPIEFIHRVLSTDLARDRSSGYKRADVLKTARKFQQLTGAVMAKAVEDTAFYRYHRLISLNEVGGDPGRFGLSLADFHRNNQERQRRAPHAMIATASHDHKRGEDTRARINALSELAEDWQKATSRWAKLNRDKKRMVDDQPAPWPNAEYLLYQAMLGVWPAAEPLAPDELSALADRLAAFMTKALREAKTATSWNEPNQPYEEAAVGFVRALLAPGKANRFLADFLAFQQRVAVIGALNGLSQCLLKLTSPGVPDFYQGTEFWDFSLVDPDNRRPVDFAARQRALETGEPDPAALVRTWRTGRIKQWVIQRSLALRNRQPALFTTGGYVPVEVTGAHAGRVAAYLRRDGESTAVVIAPRLAAPLLGSCELPLIRAERWADTALVKRGIVGREPYRDVFTGRSFPAEDRWVLADLLAEFPVALLTNQDLP